MTTTTTIPQSFVSPDAETPRRHPDDVAESTDAAASSGSLDGDDVAAPWGRRADGTPKAKPGRPSGTPNTSPRAAAHARARAPQQGVPGPRRQSARKAPKQPAGPDYRGGVNGILQLVAAPLAMAGLKSDAAAADAAALSVYGPGIADALHALAQERPEVAAVLEKVLSAGPYGALLAAVLPLTLQLLVNHQVLPAQVGAALGVSDPKDLVSMLRGAPGQGA